MFFPTVWRPPGMWFITEKPKIVPLSRAMAQKFANMAAVPNERPVSERRLLFLEGHIDSKTFRPPEWATAFCVQTQTEYRVNGQHTSTVLSRMNSLPPGISVIVSKYQCDTLEDVASLYATFDSKHSARTASDIYMLYASSHPKTAGISRHFVNVLASGLGMATGDPTRPDRIKAEDRAKLVPANSDFCEWAVGNLSDPKARKFLDRAACVAAMYQTYRRDSKAATKFWGLVVDGSSPDPNAPDRQLQLWLAGVAVDSGRGGASEKKKVASVEVMGACLRAWNAWRGKGEYKSTGRYKLLDLPEVA